MNWQFGGLFASDTKSILNIIGPFTINDLDIPSILAGTINVDPRPGIQRLSDRRIESYAIFESLLLEQLRPFKGETVWSVEGGLRLKTWDERISLAINVFYMDWSDLQVPQIFQDRILGTDITTRDIATGTSGAATSRGIELEFTATPIDGLSIQGSVGYLKARFHDVPGFTIGANAQSADGLPMVLAPDWTANLDVEYQATLSENWAGFIRAEWQYRSGMVASIFYTGNDGYPRRSPGRDVLNLRIGVARKNIQMIAYIENLFNRRYFESLDSVVGTSLTGSHVQPNPRTFGFQMTAEF